MDNSSFSATSSKFLCKWRHGVKIPVPRNTASPADHECVEINASTCTQKWK